MCAYGHVNTHTEGAGLVFVFVIFFVASKSISSLSGTAWAQSCISPESSGLLGPRQGGGGKGLAHCSLGYLQSRGACRGLAFIR